MTHFIKIQTTKFSIVNNTTLDPGYNWIVGVGKEQDNVRYRLKPYLTSQRYTSREQMEQFPVSKCLFHNSLSIKKVSVFRILGPIGLALCKNLEEFQSLSTLQKQGSSHFQENNFYSANSLSSCEHRDLFVSEETFQTV